MKQLASIVLVLGTALAGCGGKPSAPATGPTGPTGAGGGGSGDRLPWEAALTTGATFELWPELPEEGEEGTPLKVSVTAVEARGGAREYTLAWSPEDAGPSKIFVEGGKVRIGGAALADMQDPWEIPGVATCYAEDFSNPDGCEDVCDANLCLDDAGIVNVGGLYAPGAMPYARR